MKSGSLPLALPLLLLLLAAATAPAQERTLLYRAGDAFIGPVREARVEVATFVMRDGARLEGPRRLHLVCTYTPDGKRAESAGYAPDGSVRHRFVRLYDDSGHEVEVLKFDGRGNIIDRVVRRRAANETLVFNGDGSVRERSVVAYGPDGKLAETQTYDGSGALVRRAVNTREGGKSVWTTYGPGGLMTERSVFSADAAGVHHDEYFTYNPDGSVATHRVSTVDGKATDLESAADGREKRRQKREYDSRRNLSKVTDYAPDGRTGEYVPVAVSYYTVTYYR